MLSLRLELRSRVLGLVYDDLHDAATSMLRNLQVGVFAESATKILEIGKQVEELPDLDYRQHILAGPGWLRLHFGYRQPFATILGWLGLPLQSTDYTCTLSTNFRAARAFVMLYYYCMTIAKSLVGKNFRAARGLLLMNYKKNELYFVKM